VLARRGIWVLSLCLLVGALVPPTADARRKPTKRERTAILRALHEHAGCFAYPAGTCHEVVRVSTARKAWSAVYIRPARDNENAVQSDVASLKRRNGRWQVHQLGNGGGCSVPRAVVRDLKLACY
jgi:hypothetical protein